MATKSKTKIMTSQYNGKCSECGGFIEAHKTVISYDFATKTVKHADKCPEVVVKPPVKKLVEIDGKVEALESARGEILNQRGDLSARYQEVMVAREQAAIAIGYCPSCKGSHWVHYYSSSYECGCKGGIGMTEACHKSPEVAALDAQCESLSDEIHRLTYKIDDYSNQIAVLTTVSRGVEVEVVKGRKVAKGTRGIVCWTGVDNYGNNRVGLKVEGEEKLVYTAASNCTVRKAIEMVFA